MNIKTGFLNKMHKPTSSHEIEDSDDLSGDEETEDVYENPHPGLSRPIKRKREISPDEDDNDEIIDPIPSPPRKIVKTSAPAVKRDKVNVSADIRRDLHIRLKVYSSRETKSIIQIIEEWIEANCPD